MTHETEAQRFDAMVNVNSQANIRIIKIGGLFDPLWVAIVVTKPRILSDEALKGFC